MILFVSGGKKKRKLLIKRVIVRENFSKTDLYFQVFGTGLLKRRIFLLWLGRESLGMGNRI